MAGHENITDLTEEELIKKGYELYDHVSPNGLDGDEYELLRGSGYLVNYRFNQNYSLRFPYEVWIKHLC